MCECAYQLQTHVCVSVCASGRRVPQRSHTLPHARFIKCASTRTLLLDTWKGYVVPRRG